jgi:hypothetical protein
MRRYVSHLSDGLFFSLIIQRLGELELGLQLAENGHQMVRDKRDNEIAIPMFLEAVEILMQCEQKVNASLF